MHDDEADCTQISQLEHVRQPSFECCTVQTRASYVFKGRNCGKNGGTKLSINRSGLAFARRIFFPVACMLLLLIKGTEFAKDCN